MKPYTIASISKLHQLLELPKPKHPLISVIDFSKIKCFDDAKLEAVTYGFYCIALKKNFKAKMRYGQQEYDFDEGVMSFFAPRQVVITEIRDDWELEGYWLVIDPKFLEGFSLSEDIRKFGYFSYHSNEALHLSEEEEQLIIQLMDNIRNESVIFDLSAQSITIKQIELLLAYCNRFYKRQFITRKQGNHSLIASFEELLENYFDQDKHQINGIPTVSYFAEKLNYSQNYLSDMLRDITGQSAQQHIQEKVIDKAKSLLTTSELSVSEIAYQLGFEYPQSFHKLFKSKTNVSPAAYRNNMASK